MADLYPGWDSPSTASSCSLTQLKDKQMLSDTAGSPPTAHSGQWMLWIALLTTSLKACHDRAFQELPEASILSARPPVRSDCPADCGIPVPVSNSDCKQPSTLYARLMAAGKRTPGRDSGWPSKIAQLSGFSAAYGYSGGRRPTHMRKTPYFVSPIGAVESSLQAERQYGSACRLGL